MMEYMPYILAYVAACCWLGLVQEKEQRTAEWPLTSAVFITMIIVGMTLGWFLLITFTVVMEIVVRVVTLGGRGWYNDVEIFFR